MINLVAGGAGFIGSHLCEKLLNGGEKVVCLDNFLTGSRENVAHLCKNPNFELFPCDVETADYFPVHRIWNLACPASPPHYQRDPIQTSKTCVLGALNMLEFAKRSGALILQASTSEIYGDPLEHPQRESYFGNVNTFGPRACYDEGKRMAETLFYDYSVQHKVDVRIARIFNTYGPRMAHDDGRVVSNFVYNALMGKPLVIYGSGEQTRSFCHVDDMVEGLIDLMNSKVSIPVNIGNPGEFTVNDLAAKIIELTGSKSEIIHIDAVADDPKRRQPDISRIFAYIGWTPEITLTTGLLSIIQDFRNRFLG